MDNGQWTVDEWGMGGGEYIVFVGCSGYSLLTHVRQQRVLDYSIKKKIFIFKNK